MPWLCPCQQYTFIQDFIHFLHIHSKLPQFPTVVRPRGPDKKRPSNQQCVLAMRSASFINIQTINCHTQAMIKWYISVLDTKCEVVSLLLGKNQASYSLLALLWLRRCQHLNRWGRYITNLQEVLFFTCLDFCSNLSSLAAIEISSQNEWNLELTEWTGVFSHVV